jgi:DNA repair exonuclease SbcCD ATPase subunit
MKKIVYYVIAATVIVMATSCNGGSASMKEQLDSLQTAYEQRNADYNELNEYLGVIATGLDSIALQEGQILKSDEGPALSREQIKNNLDAYRQTLQNQRERIAVMEKKLQTNQKYSAHLRSIIATMKQQLAQKDEEIANLRKLVDDKNMDITKLKENVKILQQRNEMQAGLIVSQAETISSQDASIHTAFIKIGTKKELKQQGLLTGGFLKKTKVDFTKIDKSLFKAVDIRNTEKIEIPAKKAKLVTPQPKDSYRIDLVHNSLVLSVINPDKFWGISNFVIIQIDD